MKIRIMNSLYQIQWGATLFTSSFSSRLQLFFCAKECKPWFSILWFFFIVSFSFVFAVPFRLTDNDFHTYSLFFRTLNLTILIFLENFFAFLNLNSHSERIFLGFRCECFFFFEWREFSWKCGFIIWSDCANVYLGAGFMMKCDLCDTLEFSKSP